MIFLGGVEIKLVDFGGSVVQFQENLGGDTTFLQKSTRMGGGRYLSKEMVYLTPGGENTPKCPVRPK